jgi:hypothetical protein
MQYIQQIPHESAVVFQFYDDEVADIPGNFTQSYPEDGQISVSTKLTFEWTTASGAGNYHITVSENSDFKSPVIDTDVGKNRLYQAMTDLQPGTKYYWKVTSNNGYGSTDADNAGAEFFTAYQHRGGLLNMPAGMNNEFEADPINANGWETITYKGSATFEWSSTESRYGNHSVKIYVAPANRSDVAIAKKSAANRVPVNPGSYYAVRCWMKGQEIWDPIATPEDLQVAANIYLQFYDSSGLAIGKKSWCSYGFWGSDVWIQRHVLVTAPDNAASLAIELRLVGIGTVWFDDLTIEEYSDGSVLNHNFEEGDTGDWLLRSASITFGNGRSGQRALSVGPAEGFIKQALAEPLVPLESYVFSFWGMVNKASDSAYVGVSLKDAHGNTVDRLRTKVVSTKYQLYQVSFVATINASQLVIWAWTGAESSGPLLMDDVSLRLATRP